MGQNAGFDRCIGPRPRTEPGYPYIIHVLYLVGGQRSKAEQRVGVKSSHELGCPSPHLEALQILVARFKMGTPHELAKRGGARRKKGDF